VRGPLIFIDRSGHDFFQCGVGWSRLAEKLGCEGFEERCGHEGGRGEICVEFFVEAAQPLLGGDIALNSGDGALRSFVVVSEGLAVGGE
jgi:hypothetical protein